MDTDYFNDKKPILIFVFFLNALVMFVMGAVIWGENLLIADRVVDLCKVMFIVNLVVCGIYILIILLFIIRKAVIGGGKIYNKITPKERNFIIPQKNKHETVGNGENKIEKKVKFLDYFKDLDNMIMVFKILLLFSCIILAIFIFRIIWYKFN